MQQQEQKTRIVRNEYSMVVFVTLDDDHWKASMWNEQALAVRQVSQEEHPGSPYDEQSVCSTSQTLSKSPSIDNINQTAALFLYSMDIPAIDRHDDHLFVR